MDQKKSNKISRRDTLKALATIPVLGYFGYAVKANMASVEAQGEENYRKRLKIDRLEALDEKLVPPTGNSGKSIRF